VLDAVTTTPPPINEPVLDYAPGSAEREALQDRIKELAGSPAELPMTIDGKQRMGGGERVDVVQPHAHRSVLGTFGTATQGDAQSAIDAALAAAKAWRETSFDDRAAVFLKAADLLAGPWRQTLNAATMLGQSKTCYQAEIDSACELIDFWRYNVSFAGQIRSEQPQSTRGVWNRTDHRPLEGFVYAITPFNFTAIAGNLATAPALMGNVVLWKPSPAQQFAAHLTMQLLTEAGLPPGVINLLTGDGQAVSEVALDHPALAGIHFTGSTATFRHLWRTVGEGVDRYRTYPRLVGETGGKDFVVAHASADPAVLRTALIRGAFDYSGQKCSAASRAYVARSVWERIRDDLAAQVDALRIGDPTTDFSAFTGAVIDARSFARLRDALLRAAATPSIRVLAGGTCDDSEGWFVRPTLLEGADPDDEVFTTEYFGPVLAVHVYEDDQYDRVLEMIDTATPYALTGSVVAQDRAAVATALARLRFAAGNIYVNDKPTGAVVGQQPFGGGRSSGTNDKAGSALNLQRWTSPRSIKETFVPATDHAYPHMG